MDLLEQALNLDTSITEDEGNLLAEKIMQLDCAFKKEQVYDVATALWNIGQHRYSGVGFSSEVSDIIALWVERNFDENTSYTDRMIDVIYELTSSNSDIVVRNLIKRTKNENIKEGLIEAFAYKGT